MFSSAQIRFHYLIFLNNHLLHRFELQYSEVTFFCFFDRYDMWSVGVVMLELIVGSPHVFQISTRTRALLDKHLEGWSEEIKELAFK